MKNNASIIVVCSHGKTCLSNHFTMSTLKMQIIHATTEFIQKFKQTNNYFYDENLKPMKLKVRDIIKIVKKPYEKFKYIFDGPYEVKNLKEKSIEIILMEKLY